jgi:XcyI restriction endonuclease
MDARSAVLGRVDPNALKIQLSTYVPTDAQQILAAAGVRDEHVFPTPIILEAKPTLLKDDRYAGLIMRLCAPGALFVGVAQQNVRSVLGRSAR